MESLHTSQIIAMQLHILNSGELSDLGWDSSWAAKNSHSQRDEVRRQSLRSPAPLS